jgi:flagellar biosynthesis chaperone FliJ
MKITEQEITKVTEIVTKYGKIHKEFDEVQSIIENMSKKKDELLQRLENTHDEEQTFFNMLSKKYGPGKLNFETLEYEKDD